MNKLTLNYIYNLVYQLLILIIPLVTMPYVSRVLGPGGIGINAYSYSIVQFFILFAVLGIPLYGNRQIARIKHKGITKLSEEFWSIYLIQLFCSIFFSIIYIFFVHFYIKENQFIFYIQWLMLFAAMIDVSWLFIGLEELKKAVTRNIIVRLSAVVLTFVFIKDKGDLALYVFIIAITNVLGQLIIWVQVFKYIKFVRVTLNKVSEHWRPVLVIFLPQFIIQLYIIVDRIILGNFSTEAEVGFYDQAMKIVKVTLSIVTGLSTVMLPRIAAEYARGNSEKIIYYSNIVLRYVLLMTIPMSIGIATISTNFTSWFFGPGYGKVEILIIILSPIIIFIGLSNVFGMQILLPTNQNNKLTLSVSIGAIVSIFVNILLVSSFASIGTAIATVSAEVTVAIIQLFFVSKYINLRNALRYFIRYGATSIIMGLSLILLGRYFEGAFLTTLIQVIVGAIIYLSVLLLLKDELLLGFVYKIMKKKGE
ncbi:oligosaccharide flippase family protein [Bacillus toyonensis]|nr:oligosaccharide flippase family protein [Bacillus toyonensis]